MKSIMTLYTMTFSFVRFLIKNCHTVLRKPEPQIMVILNYANMTPLLLFNVRMNMKIFNLVGRRVSFF